MKQFLVVALVVCVMLAGTGGDAMGKLGSDVLSSIFDHTPYRGTVIARYRSSTSEGGTILGYDGSTGAYFQINNGKIYGVDAEGNDFKGDSHRQELVPIEGVRYLYPDSISIYFPMIYMDTIRRFPDRATQTTLLDDGGVRVVFENLLRGQIKNLDPERAATWPFDIDEGDIGTATIDINRDGAPTSLMIDYGSKSGSIKTWNFDYGPEAHKEFPVVATRSTMRLDSAEYSDSDPERFTMEAVYELAQEVDTRFNQSPPMILVSKDSPVQLSPESDVIAVPEQLRAQSEQAIQRLVSDTTSTLPLLSRWPLILTGITLIAAAVWYRVRRTS